MDSLSLDSLEVWTHIGVPEAERASEQRLLISIELSLSLQKAGKSDDMADTINYQDVTDDICLLAKTERKTIERLAEDTAQMILKNYKPDSVTVTVEKCPLIKGLKAARVTIKR